MNKKPTGELLEMLKGVDDRKSLKDYLTTIEENMTFSQYIGELMKQKKLDKSAVVKQANIHRTYAYQILDGSKNPGRDKAIAICIAMNLTLKETQRALTLSENRILYAKDARDSIIIFCINKKASIMETNELLYEEKQPILN